MFNSNDDMTVMMHVVKVRTFGGGVEAHPVVPALLGPQGAQLQPQLPLQHPPQPRKVRCAQLHNTSSKQPELTEHPTEGPAQLLRQLLLQHAPQGGRKYATAQRNNVTSISRLLGERIYGPSHSISCIRAD